MKKPELLITYVVLAVFGSIIVVTPIVGQAAESVVVPSAEGSVLIEKRQPVAKPIYNPALVPKGKTYYLMENGKVIKKFRSGATTVMAKGDCIQITCPPQFPDDVVCWKCYERPKDKDKVEK